MRGIGRLDEATLREFVHTAYPRLVAAVALVAGSRAAAEDVVQEALTRAWEYAEKGGQIESLPAWVTAVSLNLARSGLRRLKADRSARERLSDRAGDPPGEVAELVDLRRALTKLTRRQREATVLRYYLGMDIAEIAEVMACPEGTVKSLLSRARSRMATALGEDVEEVADRGQA